MRAALLPLLAAAGAVAVSPVSARAEASSSNTANVTVGPIASGPAVSQGSAGFDGSGIRSQASSQVGEPLVSPGAGPGPGSSDLTFKPVQDGVAPGGSVALLVSCPPGAIAFAVYDSAGTLLGIVCAPGTSPPAGLAPPALELAQRASSEQPWPVLHVGVNPGTGLAGLASWFWLDGSARMPDATASAGPLTVRVHAALIDVAWDFGDGSGLGSGTDLGRPFPAPSAVQHVYQTDTFGRPGGYTVSALLRYQVTYSVNGGPFSLLGVKARPYSASYQVNQLQPEGVSAR